MLQNTNINKIMYYFYRLEWITYHCFHLRNGDQILEISFANDDVSELLTNEELHKIDPEMRSNSILRI